MIRTYFLPVLTVNNTEQVAGIAFIHDALLETTLDPLVRQLIQDTTTTEHNSLKALAISWHTATQKEKDLYHAHLFPYIPNPDHERIKEILHNSPPAIPEPEKRELFTLLAKIHGIHT